MPEVDAVEVVKTIRSKEHHYTYLMVPMQHIEDKEWLLRALAAGADDFVHKPILREEPDTATARGLVVYSAWRIITDWWERWRSWPRCGPAMTAARCNG